MKKLFLFDLDSTLAPVGKGMRPEHIQKLQTYERRGVSIAVCSGKPAYYLCGFARQLNLKKAWLIGENGAVVWGGVDLPPTECFRMPFSETAARKLKTLTRLVEDAFSGRIWLQPNEVMLTPFFRDEETRLALRDFFRDRIIPGEGLHIYEQCDCFDVCPEGIDKGIGARFLMERLGCSPEDTVAVGDGSNDYPMFQAAGTSVGIRLPEPDRADFTADTLTEAFRLLDTWIN
jgi:HAD superfamily hydrolase (TIGR01484 family)